MNVRDKKGSITIFVLVGLLFMSGFLLISFGNNVNKSKVSKEQFNIISSIYSRGDGIEKSYERVYTTLRKKNAQTLNASVENSSSIELTKTFEDKISNYRIYGNEKSTIELIPEKLPEEYQEVEWIGTDGNSYFVSNFNINNLDKFTIYYRYNTNGTSNNYMWGASNYPNSGSRFLHRYTNIIINNDTSNAVSRIDIPSNYDLDSIVIVANNTDKTIACYYYNTVYSTSSWNNNKDFDNFGIFCNNYSGQPSSYKARSGSQIAEFRVVNDDTGEEVFNLIPCYRKSDNVIGMYDLVSKVFFTNEGTGTFTKGANIETKSVTSVAIGDKRENIFNADDIISKNLSTVSRVQYGGKSCLRWNQSANTSKQRMLGGKFKANTLYYIKGSVMFSEEATANTYLFGVFYTDGTYEYINGKKFGVTGWTIGEFQDILLVIGKTNKTILYISGVHANSQNIYIDESTFQIIEKDYFLEDRYIKDEEYIIPISVEKKGKNLFDIGRLKDNKSILLSRTFPISIHENTLSGVSESQGLNAFLNQKRRYESGTYSISAKFSGLVRHIIIPYDINGNILTNSNITISGMTYNANYNAWTASNSEVSNIIIPDSVAYWHYGSDFWSDTNYEKVTIENIQIEKGSTVTAYEEPTIKYVNIFLKEPLKEGEYIDFKTSKVVRTDGTEESIELPELLIYEDYTKIEVLTEIAPSKIEVEYLGYTME